MANSPPPNRFKLHQVTSRPNECAGMQRRSPTAASLRTSVYGGCLLASLSRLALAPIANKVSPPRNSNPWLPRYPRVLSFPHHRAFNGLPLISSSLSHPDLSAQCSLLPRDVRLTPPLPDSALCSRSLPAAPTRMEWAATFGVARHRNTMYSTYQNTFSQ